MKFNGKKIAIKTERDVEIRLQIKKEPNASNKLMATKTESIQNGWEREKHKLIEQIVALKTENQQNHLALKKKESECAKILLENKRLEKTLSENDTQFSLQMDQLRSQLIDAKQDIVSTKVSSDKIISDLKRENKFLLARNKQFQTGMEQRKSANATTDPNIESPSENNYEVEEILDHKNTRAGRKFLIRWKGYDSDDDTWEKESNLKCPEILNKYLDSIKKK